MSENNATPEVQGDPAALGDAGKAALVAERKRADEAERLVKELTAERDAAVAEREKTAADAAAAVADIEAKVAVLEQGNADLSAQVMRLNVGIDAKLPRVLIDRLTGDGEDALKQDAEALKAFVSDDKPSPFPKADPSQGANGAAKASTAEQFAAAMEGIL